MSNLRLLEKLRFLEATPGEIPGLISDEFTSIMNHIQYLLGTHSGTVPIADDYGMPDVFFSQGVNFKESSRKIKNSLETVIAKYEPRLTNITVELITGKNDLLKQHFGVKASLSRDVREKIEFIISISSEAKISISKKSDRD